MNKNSANTSWFLYLIRIADGRLYTGITTDVERRFAEHQAGGARAARSLRGKGPLGLVFYQEVASCRSEAQKFEARVKRLPRLHKERIVSTQQIPAELL